jgi:3-oxoadipate enol-lactonase
LIPAHEFAGSGPPLVLIPGTFSDRRAWLKLLGHLTPRFRCLLFDPRGSGDTPDQPHAFAPDDLVEDVLQLLDSASIERASIIGHSLGAGVALLLSARYPGRVNRVVACGPTLFMDAYLLTVMELWHAWAQSTLPEHDLHAGLVAQAFARRAFERLVPAVVREMDRRPMSRDTILRYVDCDRAQDLRLHAHRVDAPTLVVVGGEDALSGVGQARAVADAVPGARFEVIPAAGHSPHIESPAAFARLVVDFLSR